MAGAKSDSEQRVRAPLATEISFNVSMGSHVVSALLCADISGTMVRLLLSSQQRRQKILLKLTALPVSARIVEIS